ncbi:MAG: type II toxin-antitoxin system PemK/MazF family toxin [Gemmatimonadota bacterium]|nr:type II toxin-antitoxin system PemK/MazF family toxin [Gemmatimonadota bacterium]
MTRGDIWTVAAGPGYPGKPRPAVIIQDGRFDATDSVTIVAFTTSAVEAPLIRLPVAPSDGNGLRAACQLMVDKVTTVPRARLGAHVGRLGDEDVVRLNRALLVFLGLASPVRRKGGR